MQKAELIVGGCLRQRTLSLTSTVHATTMRCPGRALEAVMWPLYRVTLSD
jgi:hypothetical protein